MDFYDNEERRKAITDHIAKLRDIAALYPVIVPVIFALLSFSLIIAFLSVNVKTERQESNLNKRLASRL